MVEVSSSILSVKKGEEAEVFLNLEKSKTDYFHIDVMDGKFVEKNTYKNMQEYVSYIRRISSLPIDVHLMVEDIKQAIDDFSMVEPNIITFHIEACKDEQEVFEIISLIKETHARVGISVKPDTDVEKIYKFLPYVHVALIMTVEPGKGGQTLLVDMLEKIKKIKEYILKENLDVDIEADGGINLSNSEKVKNAGADILVAGTAILSATDYKNIIQELKA
jgi:ribulose-phosphate 3-epimerase